MRTLKRELAKGTRKEFAQVKGHKVKILNTLYLKKSK